MSRTVCHLMPVGKPAPPRPRRPESVTVVTISCGRHLERPAQPQKATARLVVRDRERVVHPDSRECETRLTSQLRDLLGPPEQQRVGRTVEHARLEQLNDACGRHRAVGDAPFGRADLDQRFEPEQPS